MIRPKQCRCKELKSEDYSPSSPKTIAYPILITAEHPTVYHNRKANDSLKSSSIPGHYMVISVKFSWQKRRTLPLFSSGMSSSPTFSSRPLAFVKKKNVPLSTKQIQPFLHFPNSIQIIWILLCFICFNIETSKTLLADVKS